MSIRSWVISKIAYPIADRINGTTFLDKFNLLNQTQWWKEDDIRELQYIKLRRLLEHAYQNVPFYRRLLKNAGITPSDIRRLEDLKRIPILTKHDVRNAGHSLIADNLSKQSIVYARTGGSTGEPLQFLKDKNDVSWAWGAWCRFATWAGVQMTDKRITVGGGSLGGYLANHSLKSKMRKLIERFLTWHFFPAFSLDEQMVRRIGIIARTSRIRVLRGYPSTLYLIAKISESQDIDVSYFKQCFTTAERLYPHQRDIIERIFSADVYDQYGCAEVHSIAGQCDKKDLYHVFDEHALIECYKTGFENSGRVQSIITNLDNYAMPFIRYDTGDVLYDNDSECDCGRGLTTLKKIEGRTHDFLVAYDGRVIPGEFIPHLFQKIVGFDRYFFYQKSLSESVVKIIPNQNYSETEIDSLKQVLKAHMGGEVEFSFIKVEEDELPLSPSGKLEFIKSEVKTSFD